LNLSKLFWLSEEFHKSPGGVGVLRVFGYAKSPATQYGCAVLACGMDHRDHADTIIGPQRTILHQRPNVGPVAEKDGAAILEQVSGVFLDGML
jgi:hypothetical protein